jgi:hypothetical protein
MSSGLVCPSWSLSLPLPTRVSFGFFFELGPGVQFNGQHNPLPETGQPNTYRIFDNGNGGGPATGKPSRVIDVRIDTAAKTATLVKSVEHPDG